MTQEVSSLPLHFVEARGTENHVGPQWTHPQTAIVRRQTSETDSNSHYSVTVV